MRQVKVIVGATATGKTARAIDIARTCNGVIINCDSLQVYDELRILTAFPTDDELAAAGHRLFGYLRYDQQTNAVEWARLAAMEIEKALQNGHTPVMVGGTGLYVNTLMYGVSPMPVISEQSRKAAVDLASDNFAQLCKRLYKLDPELENLLPMAKHHQLVRAYEVFLETGRSIRYFWAMPEETFVNDVEFDIEVTNCERSELYRRIELRFDKMLQQGAIEEVEKLLRKVGNDDDVRHYPIFKAIGAKEIAEYLRGDCSFDEMRTLAIKNSRHYAKRQMTWFRRRGK
jgi:tRNA dimethylallyltransferase